MSESTVYGTNTVRRKTVQNVTYDNDCSSNFKIDAGKNEEWAKRNDDLGWRPYDSGLVSFDLLYPGCGQLIIISAHTKLISTIFGTST